MMSVTWPGNISPDIRGPLGKRGQPVGIPDVRAGWVSFDACPLYLNYNIMMSGESYDFFQDTQLTGCPVTRLTQFPLPTRTKAVFQIVM